MGCPVVINCHQFPLERKSHSPSQHTQHSRKWKRCGRGWGSRAVDPKTQGHTIQITHCMLAPRAGTQNKGRESAFTA